MPQLVTFSRKDDPHGTPCFGRLDGDAITDLTAPTLAVAEAADGVVDVDENADGVQVQVTPPAEASAGDEITVTLTQPDGNSISISNTIPYDTVSELAAIDKTLPKIGPMQGVHPNANDKPIT